MLFLCTLSLSPELSATIRTQIRAQNAVESEQPRYDLILFEQTGEFIEHVAAKHGQIDCLLLAANDALPDLLHQLRTMTILLPTVILNTAESATPTPAPDTLLDLPTQPYHDAVTAMTVAELPHLDRYIEEAIALFLRLSSADPLPEQPPNTVVNLNALSHLSRQQHRLAEKLKERLEYLGVYYKRNPANFLRRMAPDERDEFLQQLKQDYRKIVLSYFSTETSHQVDSVNTAIDSFVNLAFFADISVAQIVEIHMELMDEFAKQLKLEGRSADVLQDYRLTLIDIIAHLCEMYRRSIPRES